MKKIILSLVALVCGGTIAFAQPTNVQNAHNLPTVTGMGFEYKFLGSQLDNCAPSSLPGSNNIWNSFTAAGYTVDFAATTPFTPIFKATSSATGLLAIRLPDGNCGNVSAGNADYVDCSVNKKIRMIVNSDVAVAKFSAMLAVDNSGYVTVDGSASDPRTTEALPAGTDYTFTITSPTTNYLGTTQPLDKVIGMVFTVHDATDVAMTANITVKSIQIGDAVSTTATTAAVDNSLISVYPNPAKDQINIDLSSMNSSDASVKIMNSNGMLVYQGKATNSNETINTSSFNKGIYMVQVASGDKISNKKIVIE